MKTMQTRIILSHIMCGARPCYEAANDLTEEHENELRAPANKRQRTVRVKKNSF